MAPCQFRKLDGILLLDKPLGMSSNKALQEARFLFAAEKAGHTGSLDPLASGLLPLCFGEATKVSGFLLDADKSYITTARFGYTSNTGDEEGEKQLIQAHPKITSEKLEVVLAQFRGEIQQIPPMYSALKKDGQPLYKLARQGIEVERVPRNVVIHDLKLLDCSAESATLEVQCSKGTYIRSLVEDIGATLGVGAYVASLRRTAVSPFNSLPMYSLEALTAFKDQREHLDELLLPIDQALMHLPELDLNEAESLLIQQGQKLALEKNIQPGLYRLYKNINEQAQFMGMGELSNNVLRVKRLLAY
ncbi:MAG TPA: tRNA pseudouridine(55) synthase TruB [Thiolinea sp.]|nr:tRNA pseudouridine(55) synthase TruB [uncultured Thiothrix sp.]HMT91437.1 tRNA pseudouridine(55) synthase TruB [Thiolinea sp.]